MAEESGFATDKSGYLFRGEFFQKTKAFADFQNFRNAAVEEVPCGLATWRLVVEPEQHRRFQHGTEQYRLRLTNNNKLILVK